MAFDNDLEVSRALTFYPIAISRARSLNGPYGYSTKKN
jgi:hypothetical protein